MSFIQSSGGEGYAGDLTSTTNLAVLVWEVKFEYRLFVNVASLVMGCNPEDDRT